ncbi:unnamed protein product [Amoebophrya sp. A25]|nr:unnamed protein product [Amoebophrya sp. A25]|eukprot:GSA25T00025677001.1
MLLFCVIFTSWACTMATKVSGEYAVETPYTQNFVRSLAGSATLLLWLVRDTYLKELQRLREEKEDGQNSEGDVEKQYRRYNRQRQESDDLMRPQIKNLEFTALRRTTTAEEYQLLAEDTPVSVADPETAPMLLHKKKMDELKSASFWMKILGGRNGWKSAQVFFAMGALQWFYMWASLEALRVIDVATWQALSECLQPMLIILMSLTFHVAGERFDAYKGFVLARNCAAILLIVKPPFIVHLVENFLKSADVVGGHQGEFAFSRYVPLQGGHDHQNEKMNPNNSVLTHEESLLFEPKVGAFSTSTSTTMLSTAEAQKAAAANATSTIYLGAFWVFVQAIGSAGTTVLQRACCTFDTERASDEEIRWNPEDSAVLVLWGSIYNILYWFPPGAFDSIRVPVLWPHTPEDRTGGDLFALPLLLWIAMSMSGAAGQMCTVFVGRVLCYIPATVYCLAVSPMVLLSSVLSGYCFFGKQLDTLALTGVMVILLGYAFDYLYSRMKGVEASAGH